MELKNSGSNLAQILKTVGWNSAAFRAYLSFDTEKEYFYRWLGVITVAVRVTVFCDHKLTSCHN